MNSDFGLAAERFRNEYLPTVDHRPTTVILGDGCNYGKELNTRALEEIVERTKQTIGITQEPQWGWTLGSCDLPLYEPTCNRVWLVRTVDQLASVAEALDEGRV